MRKRRGFAPGVSPVFDAAAGSFVSVAGALALTILLLVMAAPQPGKTLTAFFIIPWSSPWFAGNTLDSMVLLLSAGLGFIIAHRAGCFNLGGEGQVYLGGIAAAALLTAETELPGGLLLTLGALAAGFSGAVMGAVPGWLKRRFGANEMIGSFLLSASLIPLGNYLITGPLRDLSGNLLATRRFVHTLTAILPPSSLSLSLIFALALLGFLWFFLARTAFGYRLRIAGTDPAFARFGGLRPERYWVPAMALSGGLGGLAGFFSGICHLGFSGGLGWNALAAALIARGNPPALIPAVFVLGWLKAGSDAALLSQGIGLESAAFIQAAVLLLATVRFTGPLALLRGTGGRRV